MKENFEIEGIWFLPSDPNQIVSGTLRFDTVGRIQLDTIGSLGGYDDDPNIILGTSTDGKKYTLLDTMLIGARDNSSGMSTRSYSIDHLIKNGHFKNLTDIQFDRLYCQYNLFEDWVGSSVFQVTESIKDNVLEIKYHQPDDFNFEVNESINGKITFSRTSFNRQRLQTLVNLEQQNYFELEFKDPVDLQTLMECQHKFQNFLTLATAENVFPEKVVVRNTRDTSLNEGLEVYFSPFGEKKNIVVSKIEKFMLFTFKDVKDKFSDIISSWYIKCNELEPVIFLLFNNLYNKGKFSPFSFLGIIQALETFHRYLNPTPESVISKHEKRVKNISDSLTGIDKGWIKYKLKYAFEPSLHDRLNEILDNYSTEIILQLLDDREKFIRTVVNDRNFYTHYDKRLEETKMNMPELIRVTEILQLILTTCILTEIGFEKGQLLELHKNGNLFSRLAKNGF